MSNCGTIIIWSLVKSLIKKYMRVIGISMYTLHLGRKTYFAEWDSHDAGKPPQRLTYQKLHEKRSNTFLCIRFF